MTDTDMSLDVEATQIRVRHEGNGSLAAVFGDVDLFPGKGRE